MNPLLRAFRIAGTAAPVVGGLKWSTDIAPFVTTGSAVTIAVGTSVLWDVTSTPLLGSLTINGTLVADSTKSVGMTVSDATVAAGGVWKIAGPLGSDKYQFTATITINGARTTHTARPNQPTSGINQGYTNDGLGRALNNRGTRFFRAGSKLLPKTKLKATGSFGATSLTLQGDCSDWAVGDAIVIAPTNFYGQSVSEKRGVTSVGAYSVPLNTTVIGISIGLTEKHWGDLQYPIDAAYGVNAMSLGANTQNGGALIFTAPDVDTPTVYDSRAEVINLSSGNIIIQAPNDATALGSLWTSNGWGVHTMDHPGSTYYDEGVRIVRGGQRGALGRYPFHAHSLSYTNQRAAVTFDRSGPFVIVNWPNHGITQTASRTGTVTFSQDVFVGSPGVGLLLCQAFGLDTSFFYNGAPFVFQTGSGSTLPTGITANRTYLLFPAYPGGKFYVCTSYPAGGNAGAIGAPSIPYTDSGTGTTNIFDASLSDQAVQFQTTATLPNGLTVGDITPSTASCAGTIYYVAGPSITPNSFAIASSGSGIPISSTASAGSGTHSGLWTKFTGDATGCERIKCVVDTSENRAYTTHASCGTTIQDSIAYDVKGWAFFLEDGSEERNIYTRNFALKVRNPILASDTLKDFDRPFQAVPGVASGSGGHWWSNVFNQFTDNITADCEGAGVVNSLGFVQDLSALVNINPQTRPVLRWLRNGAHTCNFYGLMTPFGVDDAFGRNTLGTTDMTGISAINILGFPGNLMEGGIAWKNNQGGYNNVLKPEGPFYKGWMTGDNMTGDFQGAMNPATKTATSILMVGQSLNDGPLADISNESAGNLPNPRFGNATYHFTLTFTNIAYQNFPWVRGYYKRSGQQEYGGGAVAYRDQYTYAVSAPRKYSLNNKFNNTHPGHLTQADRYSGSPITLTLANPCILSANIVNATTGDREFQMFEGEPLRFVRTTGTLPSPFVKDTPYFATNVRTAGGALVGGGLGVTCELALTSGGVSISTAAGTQTGNHSAFPMWVTPHVYWVRGMGTCMPDPEGNFVRAKTGAAPSPNLPQYVCPYGDNPYFTTGAQNFVYVDPDASRGLDAWGFSTSDLFIGIQHLGSNFGGSSGLKSTRVTPTTLAPIGVYAIDNFPPDTTGYFFQDNQTAPMLSIRGGQTWYTLEPGYMPDGTGYTMPTTLSAVCVTAAQDADTDVMIAMSLSGARTINTVFRTIGAGGNTTPSSAVATTGMSVTCSAATGASNAAKLAAVAADAAGGLYWQDTANNRVWIRHKSLPGNAQHTADQAALINADPNKSIDPAWIVIQAT